MPDYDDTNDDDDASSDDSEGMRGLRTAKKAAEAEQKRLSDELAAANADRRELAAMKAGLNPEDKTTAFFLNHYDGDPTAEAMKAAAVEAGIIDDGTQAASDAAAGQSQMATAFGGGETAPQGSTTVGPPQARHNVPAEEAQMWQEFEQAVRGPMGAQAGQAVLEKYGRPAGGLEVNYEPGAGGPVTQPGSWG